jgi:hypothetical protein
MITLKETLVKERTAARDEKARLEDLRTTTNSKAGVQEEFNKNKQK